MARKPRIQKDAFTAALIRNGYLPEETPPIITAKYFSENCKNNYKHWESVYKNLIKLNTQFDSFSIPRPNTGRRMLALVNPIAQLGLSIVIAKNRKIVKNTMSRSKISLYDNNEALDIGKAFIGLNFNKWHELQDAISSEYAYGVKIDVSRYFYTIYTHSIPWAVLGKKKSKKNYKEKWFKSHWSNEIDMALQSCQSRETFGIPVGPDTSRIISEILMSGIESENSFLSNLETSKAIRLVDDIYIGANKIDEAQSHLNQSKIALGTFNLQVNEEKTFITETKNIFDDYWKRDFNKNLFPTRRNSSDGEKVKLIVDSALYHCKNTKTELPAIWASRRLISLSRRMIEKAPLVDAMFRLGRDFPSTTKHIVEFLVNNHVNLNHSSTKYRIVDLVKKSIRINYEAGNDLELSWMLLVAGIYRIRLSEEDFGDFSLIPKSMNLAILGLLRQHGIVDLTINCWDWKRKVKTEGIYGSDWLLTYESVARKWTKDQKIISLVRSCPYFSRLLLDKVTFLDDKVLNISEIDFKRRKLKFSRKSSASTGIFDWTKFDWSKFSQY